MPESPLETYNRLLQALDQLGREAQRVDDAGVREWMALATLDAIDLGGACCGSTRPRGVDQLVAGVRPEGAVPSTPLGRIPD